MQNSSKGNNSLKNYAKLREEKTSLGDSIYVDGRTTPGDGGAGFFEDIGDAVALSISDDDGFHIVTGVNRALRRQGTLSPEHYGGVGYSTRALAHSNANDTSAIIAKMDTVRQNYGAKLEFPENKLYYCSSAITLKNYGCDIRNMRLVFPGTGQITGVTLVDADAGKELTVKPEYRNITILKGSSPVTSDWTSYSYPDTMIEISGAAAAQTWAETDIGFRVLAQSSTLVERLEVQNFAIGLCQDTIDSTTGSPYNVWNKTRGLMTTGCRIAELVKCEGIDTGNRGGWLNEYSTEHARTNIGIANQSSYGFVIMSDPAKVAAGTAYIPTGITVIGGSHEGEHTGGQETVPLLVFNARGLKYTGRNDVPGLTFRVADIDPDIVTYMNSDIEINLNAIWLQSQFDIDGAIVSVRGPGIEPQKSTIIEAQALSEIIHTYTENEVTAQSRFIAFEDFNETTDPLIGSWQILTAHNANDSIDNYSAGRIDGVSTTGSFTRGGIGAHIYLGEKGLGGTLTMNISTNSGLGRLGAICYDSTGAAITSLPIEGWLVKDTVTGQGTFQAKWAFSGGKSLSSESTEDRAKKMIFHPDVESVFLFCYSDSLKGFTIEATNLPGAKAIPVKSTDLRQSSIPPQIGVFDSPVITYNSDSSSNDKCWRYNQSGTNYAVAGTWYSGATVRRGDIYAAPSGNPTNLWRAVSGFGSGQGADTATTGATSPSGTGPFVSDGTVTWQKLSPVAFTGNIATFETCSNNDRKSDADVLGTTSGTTTIDFDSGLYDNKVVTVTGPYSPSWTPTRIGIYSLTVTMDGVGGHIVTFPTLVGTAPTVDTTANESTELIFFWNGSESVVISSGV